VLLVVIKMEGEILDYRLLTWRAENESRIYCWFSWLDAVVSIPAGLSIARSPPEISFYWRHETVVVTFLISRVEMCSICTQRQFENIKLRLAKLLQPVESVVV
jgi:hypothetical protein